MSDSNDIDFIEALKAMGFTQQEIGIDGVQMFTVKPAQAPQAAPAAGGPEATTPTEPSDPWDGAEVIASYTRAEAIADGVLVDLLADVETGLLCQEAGFQVPVAITRAAFSEAILAGATEAEDGEFTFPPGQSLKGRLWDVLMMLRMAVRGNRDSDRVFFKVLVDTQGDGMCKTVSLWSLIGPGDDARPVLTIMMEGED